MAEKNDLHLFLGLLAENSEKGANEKVRCTQELDKGKFAPWKEMTLADVRATATVLGLNLISPPPRWFVFEPETKKDNARQMELCAKVEGWLKEKEYLHAKTHSGGDSFHFWIALDGDAGNGERKLLAKELMDAVGLLPEEVDMSCCSLAHLWALPGTRRKSKKTPARVEYISPGSQMAVSVVPAPPGGRGGLEGLDRTKFMLTDGKDRYAETAFKEEVAAVQSAHEGTRHLTLNKAAYALGGFVGAGRLSEGDVERELVSAGLRCGLPRPEVEATVSAALEAGKRDARGDGLEPRPLADGGLSTRAGKKIEQERECRDFEAELREILNSKIVLNKGKENEYEKPAPDRGKGILQLFPAWILSLERFITLEKERKDWMLRYVDGVYEKGGERWIKQFIQDKLNEHGGDEFCTTHHYLEITNNVKIATYEKNEKLDPYGYMNLSNGILDLETFVFMSHTPDLFFTAKTDYPYEPDAGCPRFVRFLEEVQSDKKNIVLLQEIAGYCFINGYPHQYWFLLHGVGQNGKSKFLDVLAAVIGKGHCSSASFHDLANDKFASSDLDGKRANICADISGERVPSVSTIKRLTGDMVTVQRKQEQRYVITNSAKLIFSANIAPPIDDKTPGSLRRICLVPFKRTFSIEERDTGILDKLLAEKSGVLNWALDGAKRLLKNGRFTYAQDSDIEKIEEEYEKASNPMMLFVESYLDESDAYEKEYEDGTTKPAAKLSTQELYDLYTTWVREHEIQVRIPKRKAFASEMKGVLDRCGYDYRKRGVFFYGLRLNTIMQKVALHDPTDREYGI